LDSEEVPSAAEAADMAAVPTSSEIEWLCADTRFEGVAGSWVMGEFTFISLTCLSALISALIIRQLFVEMKKEKRGK
jgi:hypothetical protein